MSIYICLFVCLSNYAIYSVKYFVTKASYDIESKMYYLQRRVVDVV